MPPSCYIFSAKLITRELPTYVTSAINMTTSETKFKKNNTRKYNPTKTNINPARDENATCIFTDAKKTTCMTSVNY